MIAFCSIRTRMTAALAALVVSGLWLSIDARAQQSGKPVVEDVEALYLDSGTGTVMTAPPPSGGLRLAPPEVRMLSMSDEGLVVYRSAGNGVSVNLDGRFRHMATATVSPEGELSIGCVTPRSAAETSAR